MAREYKLSLKLLVLVYRLPEDRSVKNLSLGQLGSQRIPQSQLLDLCSYKNQILKSYFRLDL